MKLKEIIIALLIIASMTSSVAVLLGEGSSQWLMAISYATLGLLGLLDNSKIITRNYAYFLLLLSALFAVGGIVK